MNMKDGFILMSIINKCERALKHGGIHKRHVPMPDKMDCVVYDEQQGRNPKEEYTDYDLISPIIDENISGNLQYWYRIYDSRTRLSEIHLLYDGSELIHIIVTPEKWYIDTKH